MSERAAATNTPSPDESLAWMRQIQTQMRVCDSENAVLRNLWKRAKSSGENIKEMRATIADSRLDPTEVVSNMRDRARYQRLRRIPVTAEAIFSWEETITDKTETEELTWDVEEAGYRAGRNGAKIDDNPHNPGTEFYVVWRSWWHKGQEAIARELGPDAEQASTSREHPARRGPAQSRVPGTEHRQDSPERTRKMAANVGGTTRKGRKAKPNAKPKGGRGRGRPRAVRALAAPQTDPVDGAQVY